MTLFWAAFYAGIFNGILVWMQVRFWSNAGPPVQ